MLKLDKSSNYQERREIRNALREVQGLNKESIGGIQPLSFRPRNVKSLKSLEEKNNTVKTNLDGVLQEYKCDIKNVGQNSTSHSSVNQFCVKSEIVLSNGSDVSSDVKEVDSNNIHTFTLIKHKENSNAIEDPTLKKQNISESKSLLNNQDLVKDNLEENHIHRADSFKQSLQSINDKVELSTCESSNPNLTSPGQQNIFNCAKDTTCDSKHSDNLDDVSNSVKCSKKDDNLNQEGKRTSVCRFFSRGKITSNIPKQVTKPDIQTGPKESSMEGPTKSYRSQLVIGTIGNPQTAKSSNHTHVFCNGNEAQGNTNSSSNGVKRTHSLKVLKKNQINGNSNSHVSGTVITEAIRRKSFDHRTCSISPNQNESGSTITNETEQNSNSQENNLKPPNDNETKCETNGNDLNNDIDKSLGNEINPSNEDDNRTLNGLNVSKSIESCRNSKDSVSSGFSEDFVVTSNEFQNEANEFPLENSKAKHYNKNVELSHKNCNQKSSDEKNLNNQVNSEEESSHSKSHDNTGDTTASVCEEREITSQVSVDRSDSMEECSDCQKNQEDSPKCFNEEDYKQMLQDLQKQLKECSDFTQRRKIRGRIRKLREQNEALELRKKPVAQLLVENCGRINGVSRDITHTTSSEKDYSQVDSKDELRKLLTQTNDYEEKKQIRLALRQLRQKDREREGGGSKTGPTASLTRSQSVKNFNHTDQTSSKPRAVRCTSVIERPAELENQIRERSLLENGFCNGHDSGETNGHVTHDSGQLGRLKYDEENHILKHSDDVNDDTPSSPLRRSFSLNSVQRHKSGKNCSLNSSKSSVRSNSPQSCSSSTEFSEHSKNSTSIDCSNLSKGVPNGITKKDFSINSNILSKNSTDSSINKEAINRRLSVPVIPKHSRESDDSKSGSESDSGSCREWLEKKRRNSLTVIDTRKLNSTMDIEAAFSEILNAVDTEEENNNDDDSPELEILEIDGQEKIYIKTPRIIPNKTSISSVDINFNVSNNKSETQDNERTQQKPIEDIKPVEEVITPVKQSSVSTELQIRPQLSLAPVTPLNDSLSVIEDDDGSITVQSVTYKDQGDCTVTEKTTLRRSTSRSEEEEKDTVIESKLTSPGGSDHYAKDIIKTKRKITSRGSNYYSRSQYGTKWQRNKEGETIEEHDVTMESDNYSVSQGQSWGDRSEASVLLNKPSLSLVSSESGVKELTNHDAGDNRLQVPGRMDVSKASSGYGSVSGSDEEEKEEAVVKAMQGRPSGSPEIKATLKDLVTLEGSTAVLECIAVCSPHPDITWYKGDKSLMNNRHFESKYDTVSGRATLTIHECKKEDCGPYKCLFRNPLGEAETKAVLTVRSKAKKKPQFTKALKNMVATEGHSVCLECAVNDATQVSWYKDGIIQRNTSDFKQTFDGLNAKLEIDEIFVDDHGDYACVAKNDFGESKTTCKINVKETACETGVVPMFLSKPESKILECDSTITLQCDVIGSPQPTVKWARDQQTVINSSRHKQSYDGRTAVLLVTKATIEDSGKFECVAENASGRVNVDALIVVKAKQAAPEILSPLSDQSATCGKPLTLQCEVKGNPSPMIVWRKDNRIIGNTKDFRQTYHDVTAKLQINDVHKEDGGCYECVARNVHGAITSKCSVVVEGINEDKTGAEVKPKKPLDWLVGRDKNSPIVEEVQPKSSVKRSESMKVTSNYSLRDKYRKAAQADETIKETSNELPNKLTVTKETEQKVDNNEKVDINMNKTKFEDPLKQKMINKVKGQEDPPWKNVTLRRTESARAPVGRQESPFLRRKKEELAGKLEVEGTSEGGEDPSKLVTKPPGWRPAVGERKNQDTVTGSEVLSALRQVNLRRSDSARSLGEQQKQTDNDTGAKTENVNTNNLTSNKSPDDEIPKAGQTSSTRLLFERKMESDVEKSKNIVGNFLNRSGLRRTSSLKVTAAERDSGTRPVVHSRLSNNLDIEGAKPINLRFSSKEGDQDKTIMTNYDSIDDEDELHKILSKTEDFEERKKIRNRMKELREKKSKENEVKRLQREKETEDIIKKKYQAAEAEQKRQMAAFEKAAKETKEEREKLLKVKDDMIKDHIKEADAAKKRQLAAFDKLAQKGGEGKVAASSGFGGQSFSKTPEQAAKFLSDKLINAGTPVIGGKITVRTETWNSQDGVTNKSEKTETWGAQPAGAQGAMNKFKAMEPAGAGGARPNFAAGGRGGGRGGKVMRSPSAIKEMLLNWTKAMTAGYENVEVTNFSTSWNDGMAFCALIHHFHPEAFDFAKLDPKKRRANFTLAFNAAEKYADIAPLLDVEDMVRMQKPDWKCVFTYVQSFYRKLNDHAANKAPKPEQ